MASEKNIAALMREDARTVHVVFDTDEGMADFDTPISAGEWVDEAPAPGYRIAPARNKSRTYTYVTHLDIAEGDVVAVQAAGVVKIARIVKVDDHAKIEPSSNTRYNWVIARIDVEAHHANMARNAEIEKVVADAYRANLRRGFAQQILSGLEDGKRDEVLKLIAKPDSLA